MRKSLFFIFLIFLLLATSGGCMKLKSLPGMSGKNKQPAASNPDDDFFKPAEALAKRVVLYKLGAQEGDLAPFTAKPEDLASINVPGLEVAKQFNTSWWKFEWGKATLKPLPISEITRIETDTFPLINARMDDSSKQDNWVLYTLGFDPETLMVYIANAHTDWIPEERDFYLKGREQNCLQVWCVRINGEWKIVAHLACIPSIVPPAPIAPANPPPVPAPPLSTGTPEKEVR